MTQFHWSPLATKYPQGLWTNLSGGDNAFEWVSATKNNFPVDRWWKYKSRNKDNLGLWGSIQNPSNHYQHYNQMASDRNLTRPCPRIGKAKTIRSLHSIIIDWFTDAAVPGNDELTASDLKMLLVREFGEEKPTYWRGRLREHVVMNWNGHSQLQDIAKLSAVQTN